MTALQTGSDHPAPGGADQQTKAVIHVRICLYYLPVASESGIFRVVMYAQHVAHRVLSVAQLLQHPRSGYIPGGMRRSDSGQTLHPAVVSSHGDHAFAVHLTQLLPGHRVRQGGHDNLYLALFLSHPAA